MKRILLSLLAAATILRGAPLACADDAADARKAFDMFVEYSKTDDEKMLDLFADDIVATLSFDSDKGARDTVLPAATFKDAVRKGLAKKDGNKDTYEDIVCTPDGDLVRLSCTRTDGKSGSKGPFLLVFGKDPAGTLKIKAIKMQVGPPKVSRGS